MSDKLRKGKGTPREETTTCANDRGLREDVQEFKRGSILRAATELFFNKGYENTTVDDVAAAMGVSKAVVYWNFDPKLALLEAIFARTARTVTKLVKFIQPKRTPVDNLAEFCSRLEAHYLTYRKEATVIPWRIYHQTNARLSAVWGPSQSIRLVAAEAARFQAWRALPLWSRKGNGEAVPIGYAASSFTASGLQPTSY